MRFIIPVLVNQSVFENEPLYSARPLFLPEPEVSGRLLERVLAKLTGAVRKMLNQCAQSHRLEELATFTFQPNLYEKSFRLELYQKKRTVKGDFLVVVLPDHEPRVAFCPLLPDLWFQVERGADLRQRTMEVLDHYFSRGRGQNLPAEWPQQSWLSEIEIPFKIPEQPPKPAHDPNMMILGGPPVSQGWLELEKVGRSLDDLYPHDLSQCLCRETETARLYRALSAETRTSQLLVGARKVGKTTLIHEMVRRSYHESKKSAPGRRFWLLSPQRLISGMSYLGQWEARLLSILKYADEKDLVLVFDDLLGLFSAGVSRDSNLCVADVLKPYLQQNKIRILAEATPEGLSILRERDRGFADLFHLHRLHETGDSQTLRIALEEVRTGERLHACRFHPTSVLAAVNLQRRYVKDSVFPGKAATFLRRLASRKRQSAVNLEDVYEYFHSISGIDFKFLVDSVALKRADVLAEMQKQVMGQPLAVEAAADAVMMCKSRLCDPSRPIASLLFVGPTGVGKTECAKSLARYLFQEEERLVRFDMNEFVNPGSAARLVGTFHQPDGLLTSAVRRQPFCVLLLDELEKAHQEVFNLLLQVLGDGRLTDARGRTVDFTQTIIVMTSNLGVREAGKPLGLRSKEDEADLTYRRAVEQFFPPEFFNRLDRIVPFQRLSRADTKALASRILSKVLGREGLVRRQCILNVSDEATEKIVDLGYHPELGARALKRSIEQAISNPVSARLTEMKPNSPTVISIDAAPELVVTVRELRASEVKPGALTSELNSSYLTRLEASFQRLERYLHENDSQELIDEELSSSTIWHYALQDRLRRARAIASKLAFYLQQDSPMKRPLETGHRLLQPERWEDLLEASSPSQALREIGERLPVRSDVRRLQSKFAELQAELALLTNRGEDKPAKLRFSFAPTSQELARKLLNSLREALAGSDFEVRSELSEQSARLELIGPRAHDIARSEAGFHLFSQAEGLAVIEAYLEEERDKEVRVLRLYDEQHGVLDLRTGWYCPDFPNTVETTILILSGVPHEAEVELAGS